METIKVNMSPNPLDVQTIHASQNDGEARQWVFELHNNGELIDTSEITEQMVFKSYKDGTEQLLPENGSVPTTSPFKGDIRYPQGLLTDQEFTYRQSPTESDGLAKITDIKGNTLVWNQLVQNGNFADTSWWSFTAGTLTVSNNIGTFKATAQYQNVSKGWFNNAIPQGHKLLCVATLKSYTANNTRFIVRDIENGVTSNADQITLSTTKQTYSIIHTRSSGTGGMHLLFQDNNSSGWGNIEISNVMLIDLTQMGLDITDPSEFTSLFPLPYYSYNQGSLLSFKGTSIKTVGKNLFTNSVSSLTTNGITFTPQNDGSVKVSGTATGNAYYNMYNWQANSLLPVNKSLRLSGGTNQVRFTVAYRNADGTGVVEAHDTGNGATMTIPSTDKVIYSALRVLQGTTIDTVIYPMITFANADQTYEPYTSHTTNLPISTYFPNGMKSAGSVYDELTESKAITRIGAVDLGSLTWVIDNGAFRSTSGIPNMVQPQASVIGNILCPLYRVTSQSAIYATANNMCISGLSYTNNVLVRNDSFTSASDFKTAMSGGVYLYYELATETETSFTTASLVTENTEIPLSNEDGTLIGKCTEQLSENPGFIDAKIKLSDSDGECYSNKIQLHVERSPQ